VKSIGKDLKMDSVKESFGNNHEIFSADNLEKVAVVGHGTAGSVNPGLKYLIILKVQVSVLVKMIALL
jgi:hypothetical protein